MGKFKIGDKVKCVKDIRFFTNNHGKCHGVVSCISSSGLFINIDDHGIYWNADMFEIADDWSIYNNTKPLSELTDEQVGKLVKHDRKIETEASAGWVVIDCPQWAAHSIYRAKQKSERELFIEAALLATKPFSMDVAIVKAIAEDMFNAGFEAPKVGE